uniref:maleylacetoacetate isomerase n=1 Tax=Ciona savignyi TaxID=51511 RepID=H2ZQ97_CIOSA
MSLKLYSYWRSTCSWRVRICLELKGLPYEIIPIHLVKDGGEQNKEVYRKINPLGQVPALVFDEKVMTQSMMIMEFLEEKYKNQGVQLLPDDIFEKAKVREICEMIVSGIQPIQNLSVLNKVGEDKKMEWGNYWITVGFKAVETVLGSCAGKYSVGDNITMADTCLIPQMANAVRFNVDMTQFPIISRINTALKDHPAFKMAHPDNQIDCPNKN